MKQFFLFLVLAVLGAGGVQAALPTGEARQVVESTADEMLEAMRANRAELEQNRARLYGLVDQIVLPHFDFRTMSAWVLGRYWRSATPEQRKQFVDEFRTLLVRTYASTLLDYVDEELTFHALNAPAEADDVTVRAEVTQPAGPAVPISYSMHGKDGAWKVYDVTVDGISLVTNYRSSFASQIRKDGLDALIGKLVERNDQEGR